MDVSWVGCILFGYKSDNKLWFFLNLGYGLGFFIRVWVRCDGGLEW